MKVLVTGSTGIVGSNLVRALLAEGYDVRVLVRPGSDTISLRRLPVEFRTGDVLHHQGLVGAADGCSLVFHAAAMFQYSEHAKGALDDLAVNGTRNVLTTAAHAGVERVVVTSSTVTLGSSGTAEVRDERHMADEAWPSAYTLSKIRQESVAFELARELGLDMVVVCPGLSVGSWDYRLSPSNASICNYLNDPMRCTYPGGCNIVAAEDVASGHIIAARRGEAGKRYVLGGENLRWKEVHGLVSKLAGSFGPTIMLNNTSTYLAAAAAEASARLMGRRPAVTRDEAVMACRYYWYSSAAIAALGYVPRSAEKALADSLAWLVHRAYLAELVIERLAPDMQVRQRLGELRGVSA